MGSQAPGPIGQLVSGGQGGLSPEAMEAIKQLAAQNGGQTMPAAGPAPAPQPMPAPAQSGGIMQMLSSLFNRFVNSGQSAPSAAPTPAPPTPEQLAARNRAISGQ